MSYKISSDLINKAMLYALNNKEVNFPVDILKISCCYYTMVDCKSDCDHDKANTHVTNGSIVKKKKLLIETIGNCKIWKEQDFWTTYLLRS